MSATTDPAPDPAPRGLAEALGAFAGFVGGVAQKLRDATRAPTPAAPNTAPDSGPPAAGVRVAEFLDLVTLEAGRSLCDPVNRVQAADFVMGLFDRGRFVAAEKVTEIVLRAAAAGVMAVAGRVWEEFDREALAAIGRGE